MCAIRIECEMKLSLRRAIANKGRGGGDGDPQNASLPILLVFYHAATTHRRFSPLDDSEGKSLDSKTAIGGGVPTSEGFSAEHRQSVSVDRIGSPSQTAARDGRGVAARRKRAGQAGRCFSPVRVSVAVCGSSVAVNEWLPTRSG